MRIKKKLSLVLILVAIVSVAGLFSTSTAQVSRQHNFQAPVAKFTKAFAFDISPPLRSMTTVVTPSTLTSTPMQEIRPEPGPVAKNQGYSGDVALQGADPLRLQCATATIPAPLLSFEGRSNQDNFHFFGFRVAPPDPAVDSSPN